ncbi:glucose-1-phosphate adenylyltransferase [Acidobacteriota bacterium]
MSIAPWSRRPKTLAMILAGGEGRRIYPLTMHRAKPAVPFGGRYRTIDFVLNNFVNSGFFKIKILTQFKSDSLNKHLSNVWHMSRQIGHFVDAVPAQMRVGSQWYKGTADAVYQNLYIIENERPDVVAIFGADHIYKMDINQMLMSHLERDAEVTVAGIPVPIEQSKEYGVIEYDHDWQMIGFQEKPVIPCPMPDQPDQVMASMGNYLFNTDVLVEELERDAERDDSEHDFGKNILTSIFKKHRTFVYNFNENYVPGEESKTRGYWRDIGTIDAYWQANMDLVSVSPVFNLYNEQWPLRAENLNQPAAKFVFADRDSKRIGIATDSLVSEGCIISGGHINQSILFPKVKINSYSYVHRSILMHDVDVGRYAQIRNTIIDKNVRIPNEIRIGYDEEKDRERFIVSEGGVVVISKGTRIEP